MAESISQYPMVDKFLRYLQVEKNTSPLTVKNYAADISLFSNFLAERLGDGRRSEFWIFVPI